MKSSWMKPFGHEVYFDRVWLKKIICIGTTKSELLDIKLAWFICKQVNKRADLPEYFNLRVT